MSAGQRQLAPRAPQRVAVHAAIVWLRGWVNNASQARARGLRCTVGAFATPGAVAKLPMSTPAATHGCFPPPPVRITARASRSLARLQQAAPANSSRAASSRSAWPAIEVRKVTTGPFAFDEHPRGDRWDQTQHITPCNWCHRDQGVRACACLRSTLHNDTIRMWAVEAVRRRLDARRSPCPRARPPARQPRRAGPAEPQRSRRISPRRRRRRSEMALREYQNVKKNRARGGITFVNPQSTENALHSPGAQCRHGPRQMDPAEADE